MRRDLLCDGVVNCINDEDPDTCGEARDTSADEVEHVATVSGHWFVPTLVTVTSMTVVGAGNKLYCC